MDITALLAQVWRWLHSGSRDPLSTQSSIHHLPPHLRRHYRELKAYQRTYLAELNQLENKVQRNRALMQEAVRLRVQFAQSASFAQKAEMFDRIVVLLNQQVKDIHQLADLYRKVLSDVEAQLGLLTSPLFATLDQITLNWIPEIEQIRHQIQAIEAELEERQVLMELNP
ncbi:MAG: hypothetical protein NW237_17830 [Cyanobacteriota bacterium]|nr:hypothetical protein [Cyanobacteriota bacterium]